MAADAFPIPVSEFLSQAEFHLRKGDIILSRSPNVASWLIRKITGSAFSHAAFVFLVRDPPEGYENTFLLESTSSGVGIANLRHYIAGRNPEAEIAVLRFKDHDLSPAFFSRVRGLMLDHVKADYDYGRVAQLALSLLFGVRLSWFTLLNGRGKAMQKTLSTKQFSKWRPPQFICSGFIQYGLVKAAVAHEIEPSRVFLREGLRGASAEELLAVTPEEVALSSKLEWLFVARRGWAYRVKDGAEARRIISGGRL
jgi:Permuted papain-like amidase enzyme, YaeF/YiiX, C92 family